MKTVAIAGASGFIGRWLIERLKARFKVIALTRHPVEDRGFSEKNVEWREVDLYSMHLTEKALEDVNYAIYLVHSMTPRTRLNQSDFMDTDLILADNFARAAEKNQLEQIIYLGGLVPDNEILSPHLQSRYEVERTLSAYATPVTALRAGIIVGAGGSSFNMIKTLVSRLPAMACPKWTNHKTQPVALQDILRVIDFCLGREETYHKAHDVAGPDVMTYREMLVRTAKVMRKRRWIFSIPFVSPVLSKFWVSLFASTKFQLVSPLVESLRHDLIASPSNEISQVLADAMDFESAVKLALEDESRVPAIPPKKKVRPTDLEKNTVRSIQRLYNPDRKSSLWIAKRYTSWLPKFLHFFVRVEVKRNGDCHFFLPLINQNLLELTFVKERSHEERQLFYITGGILAKRTDHGWLEFRQILERRHILAAIHDFVPKLPWFIYILSQAPLHLFVMKSFGKYLRNYSRQNY